MAVDMKMLYLEIKRKNIQDKLNSISNYERIEFEKRLRIILRSKVLKNKLEEKRILLQSDCQRKLNRKSLVELKIIFFYVLLFLIMYFSDMKITHDQYIILGVIFVITYATYMITSLIYISNFDVLHSNLEFEIDRYNNEIDQYGYFLTCDEDLFLDWNNASDDLKDEFLERTTKAKIELEIEILKCMNLEVE